MTARMLGAFAEFERALIRERTRVGVAAAVARGARPGNPKMRARDPVAIALMKAQLADTNLERIRGEARGWIDQVRRYRPHLAWSDVARIINRDRDKAERVQPCERVAGIGARLAEYACCNRKHPA